MLKVYLDPFNSGCWTLSEGGVTLRQFLINKSISCGVHGQNRTHLQTPCRNQDLDQNNFRRRPRNWQTRRHLNAPPGKIKLSLTFNFLKINTFTKPKTGESLSSARGWYLCDVTPRARQVGYSGNNDAFREPRTFSHFYGLNYEILYLSHSRDIPGISPIVSGFVSMKSIYIKLRQTT